MIGTRLLSALKGCTAPLGTALTRKARQDNRVQRSVGLQSLVQLGLGERRVDVEVTARRYARGSGVKCDRGGVAAS